VPASTVLTALLNVALNLVVVLVFVVAAGGSVRLSWLELPLLVLALAAFATGLGLLLSALYVKYRDVKPIWEVCLQILFYASPVFYPIEAVQEQSETAAKLLMLNPFAAILQQARHSVIAPSHPSAAEVLGGYAALLAPIAIWAGVIVLGYVVFARRAPSVAEQL
jgi:ABC-2 type transport system permease protein